MNIEQNFVVSNSIVRKIWGDSDMILFIFAGAAAEFSLNKAVDWLYFTGKLPEDPLGRLFSTVSYANSIIFANENDANKAIDKISSIHKTIEDNRGASIPDWAYRDVLYMLIDYTIAAHELLETRLSLAHKKEVYNVFYRMGIRMGIKELPYTYTEWVTDRIKHINENLAVSKYTPHLFEQYKKNLGNFRYYIMLKVQSLLLPEEVRKLLKMKKGLSFYTIISLYKLLKMARLHNQIRSVLFPKKYKVEIQGLNR